MPTEVACPPLAGAGAAMRLHGPADWRMMSDAGHVEGVTGI